MAPLETVYNSLSERGLSPRTVQYTNMILKQAFKQAIRWRLLTFNPCEGVELPRQQRKEMSFLSPEQARQFLSSAREDGCYALFELALTSGLRPSEYLALRWADVDFGRGTVSVVRSIDRTSNGAWQIADNKTGRSRRVVKLHGNVLDSLKHWRGVQASCRREAGAQGTELGLIFTNEKGGPLDRHNLARRNLKRILRRANLPAIRLYDLRHTAATLALVAGVPVKVVSEQLGHASSALTLDVYSHVLPHMQEEAVQKVEALLLGVVGQDLHNQHTRGTQKPN